MNANVRRILSAIVVLIIISHIFACLWYFIASLQGLDYNTWVFQTGYLDSDLTYLYLTCIYFTLAVLGQIGYGDIVAYSNSEKVMVIILMTFGSILTSFIISNLIRTLSNIETKSTFDGEKIATLNKLATRVKLKNHTYLKIKKSFIDRSCNNSLLDPESLFKDLP